MHRTSPANAPDAADWAVMVDRNRTGLFVQPWAVVVPALGAFEVFVGACLVAGRLMRLDIHQE